MFPNHYGYIKHLQDLYLNGSECWPLSKQDGNVLRIFERRILRIICGAIVEDGIWR
jgi:hypothetical protein